jgi:hypothetical protein
VMCHDEIRRCSYVGAARLRSVRRESGVFNDDAKEE